MKRISDIDPCSWPYERSLDPIELNATERRVMCQLEDADDVLDRVLDEAEGNGDDGKAEKFDTDQWNR